MNSQMIRRVSVVVPVFNECDSLRQLLLEVKIGRAHV